MSERMTPEKRARALVPRVPKYAKTVFPLELDIAVAIRSAVAARDGQWRRAIKESAADVSYICQNRCCAKLRKLMAKPKAPAPTRETPTPESK